MTKFLIGLGVVILVAAGGVVYWFGFHENENEFPLADYNFTEVRDASINDFAEDYYQNNPETNLNVEAILKQVSNLALITSALRAYSIKHDGKYPTSLEELKPDYTPPQMFAGGQIPRDHDGQPFDYRVSADKLSYTLCNDDLEKGGIECLEGGGN